MNPKEFMMFLACLSLLGACVWLIAPPGEKRRMMWLAGLGLILTLGNIWGFQQAPQWHDTNPDSITYDLNARAFALHWQGEDVAAEDYRLRGLMAFHEKGLIGTEWRQGDTLTWNSVIGSSDWLYTIYVALWYWLAGASQNMVIFSNAIWAAFFPVAAFIIALLLNAPRSVALFAAALTLLVPLAGVNASSLLKDTLAGFLAMACLCIAMRLIKEGNWRLVPYLGVFLAFLSTGRYGAFFGFLCASVLVIAYMIYRRQMKSVHVMTFSVLIALCLSGALYHMPHSKRSDITFTPEPITTPQETQASHPQIHGNADKESSFPASLESFAIASPEIIAKPLEVQTSSPQVSENTGMEPAFPARPEGFAIGSPFSSFSGSIQVFKSDVDETSANWKRNFASDPMIASVKSIAHTLFAPYPWVALSPGLNWHSFNELYFPGMILWIFCLPGIFWALWHGVREHNPTFCFLALFLASQWAAYTIWLGEWSTRQRVFVLPAFFALAAIGWVGLYRRCRELYIMFSGKQTG